MRKKGFTLIELLVVIAVIALLLSILLPSLRQAKKQARAVVCKSNLHQWALIWKMYVDDNNGKFSDGEGYTWIMRSMGRGAPQLLGRPRPAEAAYMPFSGKTAAWLRTDISFLLGRARQHLSSG